MWSQITRLALSQSLLSTHIGESNVSPIPHSMGEGAKVLVLPFDITDHKYHETAVKKVLDEFGRIDVLVSEGLYLS